MLEFDWNLMVKPSYQSESTWNFNIPLGALDLILCLERVGNLMFAWAGWGIATIWIEWQVQIGNKTWSFSSQHDSWVNSVKHYLDWYSCRPDTEIEEFNILMHILFTDLYWPNNKKLFGINVILCINTCSQTSFQWRYVLSTTKISITLAFFNDIN